MKSVISIKTAPRWTPAECAERFAENYAEHGATVRSWLCRRCGADVDSADLEKHLRAHDDEGRVAANTPKIASCPRCGGVYMQGRECGLCVFDRRYPELAGPVLDEWVDDVETRANALHARLLAEANLDLSLITAPRVSDAAALKLLLGGLAGASVEDVAALVHGIAGDEVDDVLFADMVDFVGSGGRLSD